MRATQCEACDKPQPLDWHAGQLCIHCGGVVRAETRCAACTKWTVAGRFCRHCACALVPDEWYGAARMLHAAGVDGLSLAARVAALDPEQREVFSSRFAVQRALIAVRVDEARWVESFLSIGGFAARFEDEWVSWLPLGESAVAELKRLPSGPFEGGVDELRQLHEHAYFSQTQVLAGLALLRLGVVTEALVWHALQQLEVGEVWADEAVLAMPHVRWREQLPRWSRRREAWVDAWLKTARALVRRRPRPDAALSLAMALEYTTPSEDLQAALEADNVVDLLREGLAERSEVIRLGAAWFLGDEATLESLLSAKDELVARHARQRLSALGGSVLANRLRVERDEYERRALLRALPSELVPSDFAAVVSVLHHLSDNDRRWALRRLCERTWARRESESRDLLASWVGEHPLPLPEALDVLTWAIETQDRDRPYRSAREVSAFIEAAVRAAEANRQEALGESLWRLHVLLAAGPVPSLVSALASWLQQHGSHQDKLVNLWLTHGHRFDNCVDDDRATSLFFEVWNALGPRGRAAVAPLLGEDTRRSRGSRSVQRLMPGFLDELFTRSEERAVVWLACRGFHDELEPQMLADPRMADLDGGSLATRFEVLSSWDVKESPRVLWRLIEANEGDVRQLQQLPPVVFARAEELLRAGEWRLGLWLAARFMSEVVNRFRADGGEVWRATAAGLKTSADQLLEVKRQTTPNDPKDDISGFLEQMETELRLFNEVLEREAEEKARAEASERRRLERAAEEQRRVEEQAARAEADRLAAQQAIDNARVTLEQAAPTDSASLDTEVLLPNHPLKTLRDYATFMRAMQRGADVMALMAQFDMTPAAWGACATAWGQLMSTRLELAMRFMALLQAP